MAASTSEEETALFVNAYAEARQLFLENDHLPPLAKYNQVELRQSIPFYWAAYHQMFEEHSREISNELNDVRHQNAMLAAWSKVLMKYDEQDSWSLRNEFVDNIAIACLSAPHILKGRFVFSVSHLCHQANLITDKTWTESRMPDDRHIHWSTMLKVGDNWPKFQSLKNALGEICSANYLSKTRMFRDKHHHRFPPRFELGQTELITRTITPDGKASYGFGALEPLKIDDMALLVVEERKRAMEGFDLYIELVRSQLEAIYSMTVSV